MPGTRLSLSAGVGYSDVFFAWDPHRGTYAAASATWSVTIHDSGQVIQNGSAGAILDHYEPIAIGHQSRPASARAVAESLGKMGKDVAETVPDLGDLLAKGDTILIEKETYGGALSRLAKFGVNIVASKSELLEDLRGQAA